MEGAGGVLDGADQQVVQQVPVGERRLVQRLPATPAADQVQQAVDPAEALEQRRAPGPRRLLVEQVDRAPVPALRRQPQPSPHLIDPRLVAVGAGDGGPSCRQPLGDDRPQATADPAMA